MSRRFSASPKNNLRGLPVLVSAGPTWEAWDPIRIITNRSTGAMGYAIAEAFRDAGARVTLVSGPVARPVPRGVRVVRVESARQMLAAMLRESRRARIVVGTAAVADYRPAHVSTGKLKKTHGPISLRLVRNPDILATLGARFARTSYDLPGDDPGRVGRRGGVASPSAVPEATVQGRPYAPVLIGFALETARLIPNALKKIHTKHLDYIIANRPWLGPRRIRNTVWFMNRAGRVETWARVTREVLARRLVGRLRPDVTKNTRSVS